MGLVSFFVKECTSVGVYHAIVNTIKKSLKRILDVDKLEEENKALYYFLNAFHNVKDVPTSVGSLRKLQKCDVMLLKIFDKICKKNNIPYWLDYGTLLGAHRHNGFIPWDDDMDVAMLREDYERAIPILKQEFTALGVDFEAGEKDNAPLVRIGIGYKHSNTGIWLDVFPIDLIKTNERINVVYKELSQRIIKYRKYYFRHRNKSSRQSLIKKKKEIINFRGTDNKILFHGPEYVDCSIYIHRYEDVFPLKQIEFEKYFFPAPCNCDNYLAELYGNDYMSFPHNGILHHGTEGNRLSQWSIKSHTDMDECYEKLRNLLINNFNNKESPSVY